MFDKKGFGGDSSTSGRTFAGICSIAPVNLDERKVYMSYKHRILTFLAALLVLNFAQAQDGVTKDLAEARAKAAAATEVFNGGVLPAYNSAAEVLAGFNSDLNRQRQAFKNFRLSIESVRLSYAARKESMAILILKKKELEGGFAGVDALAQDLKASIPLAKARITYGKEILKGMLTGESAKGTSLPPLEYIRYAQALNARFENAVFMVSNAERDAERNASSISIVRPRLDGLTSTVSLYEELDSKLADVLTLAEAKIKAIGESDGAIAKALAKRFEEYSAAAKGIAALQADITSSNFILLKFILNDYLADAKYKGVIFGDGAALVPNAPQPPLFYSDEETPSDSFAVSSLGEGRAPKAQRAGGLLKNKALSMSAEADFTVQQKTEERVKEFYVIESIIAELQTAANLMRAVQARCDEYQNEAASLESSVLQNFNACLSDYGAAQNASVQLEILKNEYSILSAQHKDAESILDGISVKTKKDSDAAKEALEASQAAFKKARAAFGK